MGLSGVVGVERRRGRVFVRGWKYGAVWRSRRGVIDNYV